MICIKINNIIQYFEDMRIIIKGCPTWDCFFLRLLLLNRYLLRWLGVRWLLFYFQNLFFQERDLLVCRTSKFRTGWSKFWYPQSLMTIPVFVQLEGWSLLLEQFVLSQELFQELEQALLVFCAYEQLSCVWPLWEEQWSLYFLCSWLFSKLAPALKQWRQNYLWSHPRDRTRGWFIRGFHWYRKFQQKERLWHWLSVCRERYALYSQHHRTQKANFSLSWVCQQHILAFCTRCSDDWRI